MKLYPHQLDLYNAIVNKGIKKAISVIHRRGGKDCGALVTTSHMSLVRPGNYLYLLPTHKQARKVIWQGTTLEGDPLIEIFPKSMWVKKLDNEMYLKLANGSQLYVCGSNNADSYRGISAMGAVFSEAAYTHPNAYSIISPSLLYNDGFSIHISTPFGENHFYDLWKAAEKSDAWFKQYLTIDDTGIITREQMEQEIRDGTISRHLAEQEWLCRWDVGSEGSYYAKLVNDLYLSEQITEVPWDKRYPVHTFWDLGVDNHSAIIFAQMVPPNRINIIDFYMVNNTGIEELIKYTLSKPYNWGVHVWPHDGEQRQKWNAKELSDMAEDVGFPTIQATRMGKAAGIEMVRRTFNRFWIDEGKCRQLIKCMRNYHRKYDAETKKYSDDPYKDESTDAMDALRYMCVSLDKLSKGMTAEDIDRIKNEALYGTQGNLSPIFQDKSIYR